MFLICLITYQGTDRISTRAFSTLGETEGWYEETQQKRESI